MRVISILLITAISISAYAVNYYVSPNGDDTNDGLSDQTPFETMQKGINQLSAGDTLFVMNGIYHNEGDRNYH